MKLLWYRIFSVSISARKTGIFVFPVGRVVHLIYCLVYVADVEIHLHLSLQRIFVVPSGCHLCSSRDIYDINSFTLLAINKAKTLLQYETMRSTLAHKD